LGEDVRGYKQNKPIGLLFLEMPFSITKRALPKRRKNYCQNAERITAKTPKKLLPKRRKNGIMCVGMLINERI